MTFKEACQALGLSRSSFQRKIKSGAIKSTKLGEGKFAPLEFDRADLGLPVVEPEKGPLAADSSPDLPAGDTTAPPAVTELGPLSVSECVPDRATFRDSLGFELGDPNACTLLGPHPLQEEIQDSRTGARPEPISVHWGSGDGLPSGFKTNVGYGTRSEDLQGEIDYYRRHPAARRRRFGW
jgi:excisionase family DNA binding protein